MVSIIIPTVDRHRSLVKLVESIDRQQFDRAQIEIIIVYNFMTSAQGQNFATTSPHNIKVLVAPSPGVNHARNAGILAARGDILIFIDDDCVMDDLLYIQKVVEQHRMSPQLAALGGPYCLPAMCSFWDRAYHLNMTLWLGQQETAPERSRALLGGNASYKAFVFEGPRRFTPGIRYGGSETPLNQLLFEDFGPHGFFSDLALTHQSQLSFGAYIFKAYMQGRGFAEQTKRLPRDVEAPAPAAAGASLLTDVALGLYSFIFMVGFRASIFERRFFWVSFFEELSVRLMKPFRRAFFSANSAFRVSRLSK